VPDPGTSRTQRSRSATRAELIGAADAHDDVDAGVLGARR